MNFLRTDVICMSNVLKYHSAKDPGKVDSPFEVRFDMNASRKRKNTKPKGFFEKYKEISEKFLLLEKGRVCRDDK